MQNDTMLTTQEDELVQAKISRFCFANMDRLDQCKPKSDTDNKSLPKMDFSICIKPSPFMRFSEHRFSETRPGYLKSDFYSETEQCYTNTTTSNTTGPFVSPGLLKVNRFFSEVAPIDVPKGPARKKYRKRRVKDLSKPYCTYPIGILKKGVASQYSQGFEKYIFPDAFQNNVEQDDHEELNEENDDHDEILYLSRLSNNKKVEEAPETCEDEDRHIFADLSLYNNKKTAVRVFPTHARMNGPSFRK